MSFVECLCKIIGRTCRARRKTQQLYNLLRVTRLGKKSIIVIIIY